MRDASTPLPQRAGGSTGRSPLANCRPYDKVKREKKKDMSLVFLELEMAARLLAALGRLLFIVNAITRSLRLCV